MRKPIIAGNWKMNMTIKDAVKFVSDIKDKVGTESVEKVICVPFTILKDIKDATKDTNIKIGAQNMHYEDSGAYTGEVSAPMLKELDIDYCIVGHSERRQYYAETDDTVNKKLTQAIKYDITPILCVGESLEQREDGTTFDIIKEQITKGLVNIKDSDVENIVIAYEPIWAIGTGKTATSDQANEVISFIRKSISSLYDEKTADKVRIQYGGSVKPSNIKEIMGKSDIDGALVGGASLKAEDFIALLNYND